jgi:hypothetical protein
MRLRFSRVSWLAVLLLAPLLSCRSPDPQAVLEVSDVETYWAVDPPSGDTRYIAPAARLHVKNKGTEVLRSVQATGTFRRKGEAQTWGSDWQQVSTSAKPLGPGQSALIVLKSDARYSSPVEPEAMFTHQQWKDARVEIFLRVGSSPWTKFGDADVTRHIGSRTVEGTAAGPADAPPVPAPSAAPSPSPSPSPRVTPPASRRPR